MLPSVVKRPHGDKSPIATEAEGQLVGHLPSSVCVLTCKQMGMQPCLTQTSLLIENFPCDLEAEVGNGRYSAQPQSLLMWVSGQATTYSQAL